jgi:hypothetical protein
MARRYTHSEDYLQKKAKKEAIAVAAGAGTANMAIAMAAGAGAGAPQRGQHSATQAHRGAAPVAKLPSALALPGVAGMLGTEQNPMHAIVPDLTQLDMTQLDAEIANHQKKMANLRGEVLPK